MKVNSLIVFALLITGCSERQGGKKLMTPAFTKFELCYSNGWDRDESFCFSADSSRHYNFATKSGILLYGILPDSLFSDINSAAAQIKPVSRETPFNCSDCRILAALVIRGSDTIRHVQEGIVDRDLQILKAKIRDFRETGAHQLQQSSGHFLIADSMIPIPRKVEDTKFKPPAD
jgi:hypothetical protein